MRGEAWELDSEMETEMETESWDGRQDIGGGVTERWKDDWHGVAWHNYERSIGASDFLSVRQVARDVAVPTKPNHCESAFHHHAKQPIASLCTSHYSSLSNPGHHHPR